MLNPLYLDLTYKIRGCIFTVYNNLGTGHKEVVYRRALSIEFEKSRLKFEREKRLEVVYGGEKIGEYVPDFVVDEKIILELKANEINFLKFEKQLVYYLKNTGYKLGLIANFGTSPLVIKRKIIDGSV